MFTNLGIKGRLTTGFTIMVTLLGTTAGVGWWGVSSLSDGVRGLIEEEATIAESASRAQASAEAMRRYEKDVLLNINDAEKIDAYSLKWEIQYQRYLANLDQLEKSFTESNTDYLEKVQALRVNLGIYRSGYLGVLKNIHQGEIGSPSEGNKLMEPFKVEGGRLLVTETEKITTVFRHKVFQAKQSYPERAQRIQNTLMLVFGIAALLSLVLPTLVIKNIIGPTKFLTKAAGKLAEGDVNQTIEVKGNDEQTQLALAFRNMIEKASEMANHARAVAAGDFSQSIKPRGPHDELATSLNQMTRSLARTQASNRDRTWIDAGRNLLSSRIEGKENLAELAAGITSALSEHLEAPVGLLYLPYDRNMFLVEGSFGVSETVSLTISCEKGEGVLGQAIIDRKARVIENSDDSDLKITSGIGVVSPRCVIAFPLIYNDEVTAALEFALNRPCEQRDQELLELVSGSISVTLARVVSHEKSQELLKVTSSQAKALERHRRELAEKAEELSAASDHKSRFLANMSHDLRSPMNSIMILSGLMQESDLPREDIVENSEIIQSCGQELLQLIDDILDLSKVEAGQLEFHEDVIPLADLSRTIEKTLGPVARQKGLEFHVVNSGENRKTVTSDLKRVLQVVRNLVSNAIKFTMKGSVTVTIGSQPDQPDVLAISVTDTGVGIAPDRQEIIFEEFRQAEKGTDRVYGGTGLGLSICLKLAQGLDGSLDLQSTPGQGSTFKLLIPWSQATPASVEVEELIMQTAVFEEDVPTESEKPALNGCRALVVGPDMRRLFGVVSDMEGCGCSVEAVTNFDQALETLSADASLNLLVVDRPDGLVDAQLLEPLVAGITLRNMPVVIRGPENKDQNTADIPGLGSVGYLGEGRPLEEILKFHTEPEIMA